MSALSLLWRVSRPSAVSRRTSVLVLLCAAFAVHSVLVYGGGTALPGAPQLTAEVRNGFALFQAKNCIACHQIYGLGGYMGPDLTNVMSRPGKGADYARLFLENGTDRMPNFGFSATEIDDLLRYLEFVDSSGRYPPKNPQMRWNGTVIYDGRT